MIPRPQLQFPEVNDFENPTFERREYIVRRWAHDLPVLNLVKTVPEITGQLSLLVCEPLGSGERLRLLEVFRTPVNNVVAAAENRRLRQTPISSSARLKIKDGVLSLCYAMADGYKVVLNDLLEQGHTPDADKQMHLCIQRILEQLRNALLHSFRIYRAVPPRHYQEMHQLHLFADRCNVATQPVSDTATQAEDATPRLVYLRAMLLAIADPFRLVDGAIEELYHFLTRHAHICHINPGVTGDPQADGLFLLRSDSDLPPALLGRAHVERAGESPYTLDATPLITLLNQPQAPGGEALETYAKWLLPRLKVAWERTAPRRQVDNKQARLAAGLEAAAYLLSPAGRRTLNNTSTTLGIEVQELEDEQAASYELATWHVMNESINGFMLKHPEQSGLGIRVGDVVLVVVATEGQVRPQPLIAVTRWFGVKDQSMQCGIEILPGTPVAVTLQAEPPSPEPLRGPGIYLPAIKSIQAPPTLVAPKGFHKPQQHLLVNLGSKEQTVSCGELLTATEYIDRFRFGRA